MLKKPGTFSQKYISNPVHRYNNKENVDLNGTFDDCELDFTIATSHRNMSFEKSNTRKARNTLEDKSKAKDRQKQKERDECERKEKEVKQVKELREQMGKLKRENKKVKERMEEKENELKKLIDDNQSNICTYETYIKQILTDVERSQARVREYQQNLKYCILWLVQIFSKSGNTHQLHEELKKEAFSANFQKLSPFVKELEIEEELQRISSINEHHHQKSPDFLASCSYLIYEEGEQTFSELEAQPQSFLDTFDQRRDSHALFPDITKKLFQTSLSRQTSIAEPQSNEEMLKQQVANRIGENSRVKAVCKYKTEHEDHLELEMGQEILLLRKIGELWIAESGCKIGYIDSSAFTPQ